MKHSRLSLTVLGIVLTVIPSFLCVYVGEAANLSGGNTFGKALLFIVLTMTFVGGIIGFVTSVVLPNRWLLVVGSQMGWVGGLLLAAILVDALDILPSNTLFPFYFITFVICCAIVAGLLPALIARFIKGTR
jgi:hypothetical protein